MGGPAPLGYRIEGKKLVVDTLQAEQVRTIFRRYLELESLTGLMRDLAARGILTKKRPLSSGAVRGGIPFSNGPLAYLLRNRMYLGEVMHHGRTTRESSRPSSTATSSRPSRRGSPRRLRRAGKGGRDRRRS
jgi:site-specific DNA recombinase